MYLKLLSGARLKLNILYHGDWRHGTKVSNNGHKHVVQVGTSSLATVEPV